MTILPRRLRAAFVCSALTFLTDPVTAAADQWIEDRYDEALKQANAAAGLAESDAVAREAGDLKTWIERQRK